MSQVPTKTAHRKRAKGEPASDERCGAKTRGGKPCQQGAGAGTDHAGIGRCKLHGGNTPNHQRSAQLVMAAQAVELYGLPVTTDPYTALLDELARTAGHVAWLRVKLEEVGEEELTGPVGVEGTDAESGLEHHPEGKPSVWLTLYMEERKHLTSVAATCAKAGIEERRVQIAEQQGQLLAKVINGVLNELGVPAETAGPVVRKHLMLLDGQAREVPA